MNTTTSNSKISNGGATAEGRWSNLEANNVVDAVNSKADRPGLTNVVSSANMDIDAGTLAAGTKGIFRIPLAHNGLIKNPTNGFDGQRIQIEVKYTGDFTPTWGTNYRWCDSLPQPSAEQYTRILNRIDKFIFEYNATDLKWDVVGEFFNYQ